MASETPAPTTSSDAQHGRVYVGNLAFSVTTADLNAHFEGYQMVQATILTAAGGRSKGCAIVEFADAAAAQKATDERHDSELQGRRMFLRKDREQAPAHAGTGSGTGSGNASGGHPASAAPGAHKSEQSRRVYVGNLPWSVHWQDLKDHMRSAGHVVHAEVIADFSGRSKGCGIVEYATPDAAQQAIATLSDTELQGRMIFVREDREAVPKPRNAGNNTAPPSVYVWNLNTETTWQSLKDHMRAAGNVDSVTILAHPDGTSKGCATVLYQNPKEAARALRQLNGSTLDDCEISVREDRRRKGGGMRNANANAASRNQNDAVTVLVSNLADHTNWRTLKDYFRPCGDVQHVNTYASTNTGTVQFANLADARTAVETLHQTQLDGSTLQVTLKHNDAGGGNDE